jgi:hypothetical protein
VFVRGGATYTGEGTSEALLVDVSGTAEHPVTFRAWPGTGVPRIDAMGVQQDTVDVDAMHVVLDGLELTGAGEHGISINGNEVRDVAVLRCDIHDNGSAMMTMFDNRAGIILNNGASEVLIAESSIHDNQNPMANVDGIHTNDGTRPLSDVVIADNAIHENGFDGVDLRGHDTTLAGNRIYAHSNHEVIAEADLFVARDNVICDAAHDGIVVRDVSGATVTHNTIVGSAEVGVSIAGAVGLVLTANILVRNGVLGVGADAAIDDSFNLYFDNGADTQGFERAQPETDVLADPRLVEGAAPCTFAPGPGSPALGAGPDGTDIGARR